MNEVARVSRLIDDGYRDRSRGKDLAPIFIFKVWKRGRRGRVLESVLESSVMAGTELQPMPTGREESHPPRRTLEMLDYVKEIQERRQLRGGALEHGQLW